MKYKYQLLKQDGTVSDVAERKSQISSDALRAALDCTMLEIIPLDYYNGDPKGVTLFGDEEGRFNSRNQRNPHFKVLTDGGGREWDVVGDILVEVKS